MKNLERNGIVKKIISTLLILAIALPYFPISVFAADNGNNSNVERISFNSSWSSGDTEETGTTNDTFGLNYSVTFNDVSTGFQDVRIILDTNKIDGVYDEITLNGIEGTDVVSQGEANGHAEIKLGSVDQGVSVSGQASVKFRNTSSAAARHVTVKVVGTYKDPDTKEVRKIEEEVASVQLNAQITPANIITPYSTELNWQKYINYGEQKTKNPSLNKGEVFRLKGETQYGTQNIDCGWYTTSVTATYPISVYSMEKTQKLELKITLNRFDYDNNLDAQNKMSEGYSIDWGELQTDFGTPTSRNNSDGSVTFTFTKGTDSATYNSDTAFSVDKNYNVVVTYNTPNTNPKTTSNAEHSTNVNFLAELNTVGFKLEKAYNQAETSEKITESKVLSDTRGIEVNDYKPGKNAWIKVVANSNTINNSNKITNEVIESLKNNGTAEIKVDTSLTYMAGQKTTETGYINFTAPTIYYKADDGTFKTITLTANQMKLNSVSELTPDIFDSYFKEGNNETAFDGSYNVSGNLNKFSIKLVDFLSRGFGDRYNLTYTLNKEALGLSNTELDNIQNISINFNTSGSSFIEGSETFIIKKEVKQEINNYSYMELSLGDNFDTTSSQARVAESKTVKLRMYKNQNVLYNTSSSRNNVVNENPVFFVNLPGSGTGKIDYEDFEIKSTNGSVISVDEDEVYIVNVNDEEYLVIPCIGTYRSTSDAEVDIEIKYTRTVKDPSAARYSLNAYMITDNENYFTEVRNPSDEFINSEGNTPEKVFLSSGIFNIVGINKLAAITSIARGGVDEGEEYFPNTSNNKNEDSEKEQPLIIESNKKVIYRSKLVSENDVLKNITMVSRLPQANNTYIENTSNQLLESNFKFANGGFLTSHGNKVNGFSEGDVITQTSLTNLNILGLYVTNNSSTNGTETKLSENDYKIYVTTDENADFDTTSFVLYEAGVTDLSQVKNIKVVLNEGKTLAKSHTLSLKYEMTMPNEAGMVGAQTAVKYTKVSDNTDTTLYSPASYVINGDTTGTIKIKKLFENYDEGVIPTEFDVSSLAGIKFKLQYYNEETRSKEFVQQGGEDVVATTDANGIATFNNIPAGRYYLYEVTEFSKYSGIGGAVIINLEAADTVYKDVTNILKRGTVVINKTWLGSSDKTGTAAFRLERQNGGNETYTYDARTASMSGYNQAAIANVPYGTYKITETSCSKGWTPEETTKTITVGEDEVAVNFNNVPGKGILQIEKTVPEKESVDGLSFHITGNAIIENPETLPSNPNTDMTITIGETYPSNVTVEKQDNDTKVIITINDLYLGYYHIEEGNIPYIDRTEIEKYAAVSADLEMLTPDSVNPVVIKLSNNYKSGTLRIIKTAEPGVELDQFKVRVKCDDTLYHTSYDKTFDIPASGILNVSGLYLGNYTVTEVESDYFNAKYGDEKSSTPITAEVNYNRTTTAKIYNENANGYIKILKSLEGKDASSAIGIKFRLHGKDTTGANVSQVIEITDTETIGGVKYGVGRSDAVQAGGEYELEELEETVPEFFVAMNPMKVDIKKQYTEENPLELNIENKRGKGNLEMTTKTIPEGGPLTPITYGVTEIELTKDENGKQIYNKIGSEVLVEGISGFGEIVGIDAGYYLVELKQVPDGYSLDVPQIVEVPINETGYAEFEIERNQIGDNTNVVIQKEFLKSNGETATAEDIQAAKLNENESFEAKLVDSTGKEYFVFFDGNNAGHIKGLSSGRYEIEEVFKPKYSTYAYQIKNGENYESIQKDATTGKYYFDIPEVINNEEVTVNIKIQNVLDTEFGFGGQNSIDNLSTVVMSEVNKITKTVIYITDENGNALSGVGIKLFKDGEEVTLPYENNTYVTNGNKKVKINALPAGTYTVKVVSVPEGYVVPADKELNVYEGATMVARIEVWEDKPVGSLKLSTTYASGKYAPRSKYKILDPETGRVLTFEKTASGNYVRSKLPTATDTISLRAGSVDVTGIEVGNYQLGLVDLTEKYGVVNTEPEALTIVENTAVEKEVSVKERSGFKKLAYSLYKRYAISEEGRIYLVADGGNSANADKITEDGPIAIESVYPELAGVKFVDMVVNDSDTYKILLDENGKVWTNTTNTNTFVCISNIEGHPFNSARVEKIAIGRDNDFGALDQNGKLWYWGNANSVVGGYTGVSSSSAESPICISDNTILENVEIDSFDFGNQNVYVIDTDGELYSWGYFGRSTQGYETNENTVAKPVCVTEKDESNLKGKKIKYVSAAGYLVYFIDSDGELWVCGYGDYSGYEDAPSYIKNPVCLTATSGNPLFGKKIETVKQNKEGSVTYAIDSDGKLWAWCEYSDGYEYLGYTNSELNGKLPVCISDLTENELDTVKLIDTTASYTTSDCSVVFIDENGQLWAAGADGYRSTAPLGYEGISNSVSNVPKKVNFPQDSYFDLMEVRNMSIGNNSTLILDKSGKLWTLGNVDDKLLYTALNDNSLKNYNSKELGTYIENITVKDYTVADGGSSIIVDTDNKLWIAGLMNNRYIDGRANNTNNNGNEYMRPLCWSDIEDSGIAHKNIKYATTNDSGYSYQVIGVIDEEGKLYTAGTSYTYNLGYAGDASISRYTKFECLNDKYSSLSNVKFEKVYFYDYYTAIAVASNGDVYTWGYKSNIGGTAAIGDVYNANSSECIVPRKITFPNNAKIVDAICAYKSGAAIDENGKVYSWDGNTYTTPTLLTNDNNLLGGKKVVKIGYGYNGYVYAVDSNGEVFEISQSDMNITRSITSEYDIVAKDIFFAKDKGTSGLVVIKDTSDELWAIGNLAPLGLSNTTSEPVALVGNSSNELYGKAIKEYMNGWAIVQEGTNERWYRLLGNKVKESILVKDRGTFNGLSGCYIDTEDKAVYYNDGKLNKVNSNISFSKVVDSSYSYAPYGGILLGQNKKLYRFYESNNEYVATEISGFSNIENVWVKTISNTTAIFAQDTNNNLWFKVTDSSPTTASGTSYSKISGISGITNTYGTAQKVTNFTGGKIKDMFIGDNSTYISPSSVSNVSKVFCLTENNELWAWGTGYIGNSNQGSTTPVRVLTNASSLPTILNNTYLCKDTNNTLWLWGVGYDGSISTGSKTPRNVMNNVAEYQFVSFGPSSKCGFIIDTSGDLWSWGKNTGGVLGTGDTANYANPVNISQRSGIGHIKDLTYIYTRQVWAINENNDIYYWGGYRNKTTPELVEEGFENARFEGEYGYSSGLTTTDNIYLITNSGKKYVVRENDSRNPEVVLVNELETSQPYVLTNDGKLYYKRGDQWYCINQERDIEGYLKKQFVLIKDSKYNN